MSRYSNIFNHPEFAQKGNNLNEAFNPLGNNFPEKTPFQKGTFSNSGGLIDNNISDTVMKEHIREYSVIIDSKDRNYQQYLDPFNFRVKFKPMAKSKEFVDGEWVTYEEPAPIINDNFKNVKYIKLEKIMLPLYNRIRLFDEMEDDEIVSRWKVDTYKPLTDNHYLVLTLGSKFNDHNYKSTNDLLSDSFATIYYDSKPNNTHYFGSTVNGVKTFPSNNLGVINQLDINLTDPYGNPIRCDHLNKNIRSNMVCTCHDPEGDENTDCFKHNLFHPLNPLFQTHLHFKVGVVESSLDMKTFH